MSSSAWMLIVYFGAIALLFYFVIRPRRARRRQEDARLAGDRVREEEAKRRAEDARKRQEEGAQAKRKAEEQGRPAGGQKRRSYSLNGRSFPRDLYEVLECSPRARTSTIRSSWRNLLKEEHPDRGGNTERAKRINEAYSVLLDPDLRAQYDRENGY